jgi:UDP:flavonoid glycosyltransferase YjiC (YdhE family)
MSFKWEEAAPYPSYKTLARLMDVDEKTVQRHAQSLCRKKYLYRIFQPKGSNRFDLTNLFAAVAKAESIPVKRAYAVASDGGEMDME